MLFKIAYSNAATLQNAMSGFSETEICPLKPNIFYDYDFVSANTTDNDVTSTKPTTNSLNQVAVEIIITLLIALTKKTILYLQYKFTNNQSETNSN